MVDETQVHHAATLDQALAASDPLADFKRTVYNAAMRMQRDHRYHMDVQEVHRRLRNIGINPDDYAPKPVGFRVVIAGEIPGTYDKHVRTRYGTVEEYITSLAERSLARQGLRGLQTTITLDGALPSTQGKEPEEEDEDDDEEEEEVDS